MSIESTAGNVFPLQLAKRNADWCGGIPLSEFPRLAEFVAGDESIRVDLSFAVGDDGRATVTGRAGLRAQIECQTCLEQVDVDVDAAIDFRIVESDAQAQELVGSADPFILESDTLTIAALVEDDLLLSLPSRGCDPAAACPNRPELSFAVERVGDMANVEDAEKPNPFAVLDALRDRKPDD